MTKGYIKWSSLDKMLANTAPQGQCLEWLGPFDDSKWRYGRVSYQGGQVRTHRLAYAFSKGIYELKDIKKLNLILHGCDNPPCINIFHLREGSKIDNASDAKLRERMERGEDKHNSVLLEEQVREVKILLSKNFSVSKTAKILNIGYKRVWDINKGRCWDWVK